MITLKRYGKNPIALNILISVIVSFLMFSNIILQKDEINLLILITILSLVIIFFTLLLYLGQRRFLNSIKFSNKDNNLEFKSIFGSNISIKIEQIERIKFINSKGLKKYTNGFRNRNLSIKIKDKFQPQIFEIDNISNNTKGIELIIRIIEKHNSLNVIYYQKKHLLKPDILKIDKSLNNTEIQSILSNEKVDITIKI